MNIYFYTSNSSCFLSTYCLPNIVLIELYILISFSEVGTVLTPALKMKRPRHRRQYFSDEGDECVLISKDEVTEIKFLIQGEIYYKGQN